MRLHLALPAALCALAAAGGALAQTAELDRLRMQQLQSQNMQAQAQALQAGRTAADLNQAVADKARAQTRANLNALPPNALPPADSTADNEALRRLQDRELQEGNARLRAITPAR